MGIPRLRARLRFLLPDPFPAWTKIAGGLPQQFKFSTQVGHPKRMYRKVGGAAYGTGLKVRPAAVFLVIC